jgi:hypothetical protein
VTITSSCPQVAPIPHRFKYRFNTSDASSSLVLSRPTSPVSPPSDPGPRTRAWKRKRYPVLFILNLHIRLPPSPPKFHLSLSMFSCTITCTVLETNLNVLWVISVFMHVDSVVYCCALWRCGVLRTVLPSWAKGAATV